VHYIKVLNSTCNLSPLCFIVYVNFTVKDEDFGNTFSWHCRWTPGTDSEVISMVTQRSKNIVPSIENMRRIKMNLNEININQMAELSQFSVK